MDYESRFKNYVRQNNTEFKYEFGGQNYLTAKQRKRLVKKDNKSHKRMK